MPKTAITRAGALAKGALAVYLKPKLAQDAKIDLDAIVGDLTAKTYRSVYPGVILAVQRAAKGHLAQDADLSDVADVVEALADILPEEVPEVANQLDDNGDLESGGDPDEGAKDDGDDVIAFLTGKLSDEDLAKVKTMLGDAPTAAAMDAAITKAKSGMVTKQAMDAAIEAATSKARDDQRAIREAEKAVRPYVGEIAIAQDSAEAVYRTALTMRGMKVDDVHASALPTLLGTLSKAGEVARSTPRVAQDAAAAQSYAERFPNAGRLKA